MNFGHLEVAEQYTQNLRSNKQFNLSYFIRCHRQVGAAPPNWLDQQTKNLGFGITARTMQMAFRSYVRTKGLIILVSVLRKCRLVVSRPLGCRAQITTVKNHYSAKTL